MFPIALLILCSRVEREERIALFKLRLVFPQTFIASAHISIKLLTRLKSPILSSGIFSTLNEQKGLKILFLRISYSNVWRHGLRCKKMCPIIFHIN